MKFRLVRLFPFLGAALACLFLASGCETDDDEFDHNPPAGQGSIIVDNFTFTDIEFFVDGRIQGKIKEDDDKAFDFAPGVYRVVLNDDDGNHSWADDVDVLEGRLTVLKVQIDTSFSDTYSVTREIQ
jgi:hypothetical protein